MKICVEATIILLS